MANAWVVTLIMPDTIAENITFLKAELQRHNCKLVAVSKTKPVSDIKTAYDAGQRIFGENKVQELCDKQPQLPDDIEWHMIGHLQSNKVKYMAPFVSLIHGVDSFKLLKEINKQGRKHDRIIDCLLQIHMAKEQSKFGLDNEELIEIFNHPDLSGFKNIRIVGLMGMATFTDNEDIIRKEFAELQGLFGTCQQFNALENVNITELSMGMSGDYKIALQHGSTLVRIGSGIFGARN